MDQLQRLRYITRFYPHLQGLRLIPLGAVFLITAAWRAGAVPWVPTVPADRAANWFAMLFGLALIAAMLLGRYYRRRFGAVQPQHRMRGPVTVLTFVLALSFAVWTQSALQTTPSLPLIVIAVAIGYVGVLDRIVRSHYLIVSASVLILAMLSTFGVPPHTRDVLFYAVTGLGLMVVGVGDHLLLLHSLRSVSHVQSL